MSRGRCGQWLEDGPRWSLRDVEKSMKTLTCGISRVGRVTLSGSRYTATPTRRSGTLKWPNAGFSGVLAVEMFPVLCCPSLLSCDFFKVIRGYDLAAKCKVGGKDNLFKRILLRPLHVMFNPNQQSFVCSSVGQFRMCAIYRSFLFSTNFNSLEVKGEFYQNPFGHVRACVQRMLRSLVLVSMPSLTICGR